MIREEQGDGDLRKAAELLQWAANYGSAAARLRKSKPPEGVGNKNKRFNDSLFASSRKSTHARVALPLMITDRGSAEGSEEGS
jgi:hypothetical protein